MASFFCSLAGAAEGKPGKFKPTKPYVEGEVIVQFKDGPDSLEAREANEKMGATVVKVQKGLKLALVQLPPKADTIKAVERYRKLPGVVTAEPNYVVSPIRRKTAKARKAEKKTVSKAGPAKARSR